MFHRQALLAATILAAPIAAHAQPVTGLYVGAGLGANLWHDQVSNGLRVHDQEPGLAALGAIGWRFGNGLRAELEGNYRTSQVIELSQRQVRIGGSGRLHTYGAMVNALYDIDIGLPIRPYLGAGAGYAWNEFQGVRGFTSAGTLTIDDAKGAFAYQGIVGAGLDLGAGLALTAEYRYFATTGATLDVSRQPASAALPGRFKVEPSNHAVLLGLRYAFSAAPAAATPVVAPVAAPAAARTYLVFFDFDRADLTDRARQIIAEAAGNAKRTQTTKIEVAGHADRSGTPAYNQKLSQRRADNVAAELVRQGIARNEIAVTAFGESRPLVPTADGVREPQNRRVEIVLR